MFSIVKQKQGENIWNGFGFCVLASLITFRLLSGEGQLPRCSESAAFHIYIRVDLCFEASDSRRSLVRCEVAVIELGTIQSVTRSTLPAATFTLLINSTDREGQRSLLFVFLQQRNAVRGELWVSVKKCLCICANRQSTNGHMCQGGETCKHTHTHSFP